MYLLNFYFLLAAILICLLGRWIGRNLTIKLNLVFLIFFVFFNGLIFYEAAMGSILEVGLFDWILLSDIHVTFSFFYDFLSSSMLFLVSFISLLVHVYSYGYMDHDPSKVRFFCFLSIFTFFMSLLVVSDSLVQLFFAWEGVGITSYLLINFWFTRYEANRAALKAIFINRFGDFGLYTGIILFLLYYKTQSASTINAMSSNWAHYGSELFFLGFNVDVITFISFFLFLGVVGKSAQLGLHTWLPDAMEGPTPVSALLHAATMVTAGVYLLLRLSFFFSVSNIMLFIAFWGALTAFYASTVGAFQNDIKKIIAYSTCSQLGYMVAACGLYNFSGAYFHLFNHAFFKALLFLGAGSVIHAIGDEQDLRKFGGLIVFLPFTQICLLIASLALMGMPFFSGFYSKEVIVNWAFVPQIDLSRTIYFFLLFAAFFTTCYSVKIMYYTFYAKPNFSFAQISNIAEPNIWMKLPMFVLSLFALFSGYLLVDLFLGYGSMFFFEILPHANYYFLIEGLSQLRKLIPLFFVLFAVLFAFLGIKFYLDIFSTFFRSDNRLYLVSRIQTFFSKKWFFDYFYFYIVKFFTFVGYNVLFKNFDKGLLENIFVKKIVWGVVFFGNKVRFMQNGVITWYLVRIINIFLFLLVLYVLIILNSLELIILLSFYLFYLFICPPK